MINRWFWIQEFHIVSTLYCTVCAEDGFSLFNKLERPKLQFTRLRRLRSLTLHTGTGRGNGLCERGKQKCLASIRCASIALSRNARRGGNLDHSGSPPSPIQVPCSTLLDLGAQFESFLCTFAVCRCPASLVCRSLNQSPAHSLLHLMYHRIRRGGRLDSLVVHRPWKGRDHLGGCSAASDNHIFQCVPCETTPSRIPKGILPSEHLSKWYSVPLHLE